MLTSLFTICCILGIGPWSAVIPVVVPAYPQDQALPHRIHFEPFESVEDDASFAGWSSMENAFNSPVPLSITSAERYDGKSCGWMDLRNTASDEDRVFSASTKEMNPADVEGYDIRGRRIRYSAFVKTDNATGMMQRVMLCIRASKTNEDGEYEMTAVDSMRRRPIRTKDWEKFELVIDVADDADKIELGIVAVGRVAAWIDNAALEIVSNEVPSTVTTFRPSVDSPFLTGWLWLVALALLLFSLAHIEDSVIQRFCLRFSIVYWTLYLLPLLIGMQLATETLTWIGVSEEMLLNFRMTALHWFELHAERTVQWTAENVLGLEGSLAKVSRGSGDTTYDYVLLLNYFSVSLVVAAVWSCIPWLRRDNPLFRDGHRSLLRYTLAICLLCYGLMKAGFTATQFAEGGGPAEWQLKRTYGESTPMGLLWTFMAASPMYTFFAGLMEVVPAVLLLFRRTMLAGAIMAFAVMLNVFLLNVCYDVPVKQFSFHLVIMAVIILLPEVPRLMRVFIWNGTVAPSALMQPPYAKSGLPKTVHLCCKLAIVSIAFAIPIGRHVANEFAPRDVTTEESDHVLLSKEFSWISERPDNR